MASLPHYLVLAAPSCRLSVVPPPMPTHPRPPPSRATTSPLDSTSRSGYLRRAVQSGGDPVPRFPVAPHKSSREGPTTGRRKIPSASVQTCETTTTNDVQVLRHRDRNVDLRNSCGEKITFCALFLSFSRQSRRIRENDRYRHL